MKKLFMWVCASMAVLWLAACGGSDGGESSPPDPEHGATTMVSLQLTPPQGRIPVALGLQYVAQAVMSDGKVQEVTALGDIQWRSSNSAIATVTSAGLATGVAPGKVTITASGTGANGSPIEARAQLEISKAQITGLQVTPPAAWLAPGLSRSFTATLLLSDGSTQDVTREVNWNSDDAGTATVAQGRVTGMGAGITSVTATASFNGKTVSGSAKLTVSDATVTTLQVTPATTTTAVGLALPFTATAVLSDGSSQLVTDLVNWGSGDTAIATISNEPDKWGQARGLSVGRSTIMASGTFNGHSASGTAQLNVSSATVTSLQLTPPSLRVPIGLPAQYNAIAMLSDGSSQPVLDVSWTSSDPSLATINTTGLATGARVGTAALNASTTINGQLFSGNAQLTVTDATVTALQVTPARGSVPIGLSQQYDATALMSDGTSLPMTNSASWVSDPLIATVANGLATGVSAGSTDITATAVVNGVSVTNTAPLTVTGAEVSSLAVSPGIETVSAGLSKPFTVAAQMSDGTSLDATGDSNISWSSDDSTVATVDSITGVATGVAQGSTYITAAGSINGRFLSDSASLTVGDATVMAVEVTPDPATVPVGLTQQFTALARLSDNTTQDITSTASWGSDAIGVATVIGGLATGVSVGSANITATDSASAQSGSAALTVTDAVMTDLVVTPPTASITVAGTQQFDAMATLSDGSTQEVTTTVSWSSGDLAVASIGSTTGLATGVAPGTSTITAMTQDGSGLSATAELTVTAAVAGCSTETLIDGEGKTWTCPLTQAKADADGVTYAGVYTENGQDYVMMDWPQAGAYCTSLGGGYYLPSQPELSGLYAEYGNLETYAGWPTERQYWSSTMGDYAGSHYAVNLGTGAADAIHVDTNMNAVSCVKAAPALVVSLALTPANASVMAQSTQQYVATATLSDNTTQDVSASVAWSSSNTAIATIDGSGLATGVTVGSSVISATMQDGSSLSATAQLTVAPPLPNFDLGCTIGTVPNNGQVFSCPVLQSEADANNIVYGGIHSENGQVYVLMDIAKATAYCANLGSGYRLADWWEYNALHDTYGNMYNYAGWPVAVRYWSSTPYEGNADFYWASNLKWGTSDYQFLNELFLVSCARPAS